jgi:ABC-type transporter Mla subunit MlaD
LARIQEATNPRPEPEVLLSEGSSLKAGALVCVDGVKSGVVKSVRVHPELGERPVEVLMTISTGYELRIPNDSTVILSTEGILGETFADIDTRNAHGPAVGSDGVFQFLEQM